MDTLAGTRRWKPFHGLRRKPSPNLPVTFMQQKLEGDLSPAIAAPPLEYTSELSAFTKPGTKERLLSHQEGLFNGAQSELGELQTAIVRYQIKTDPNTNRSTAASTTGSELTWARVHGAVEAAAFREGSDDESLIVKASCSRIQLYIPAFEAWLALLPAGDYGAVICGLFKIVVGGAQRANEVRIAIFQALADIPESIARAEEYRELYSESKPHELVQKTAQLCSAVLVAFRHVMVYFTEGTLKGGFKAILQGPAYKKTLQTSLDEVKGLTQDIDRQAIIRSQHRLKDVERHAISIAKQQKELESSLSSSRCSTANEEWKEELISRIGEYCEERIVNCILSHLSSNSCIDGGMTWSANAPRLLESSVSVVGIGSMDCLKPRNTEVLLSLFGASSQAPAQEVQLCLTKSGLLEEDDQDRVKWIMSSVKLRQWLKLSRSKTLLINNNSEEIQTFGPTTFLAAKMTESLGEIGPVITIHFFCTLHAATQNGIRDDAAGFMEALIVQLIVRSKDWDLTSLKSGDLQRLKDGDLESLCGLFRLLVQQLPEMTLLFIIIDGIDLYERAQRRLRFLKAVKEVMKVMEDCPKVVIKLLLACHGRSSFVRGCVDREDILTVPVDIDGDRQGWSEYFWKKGMGREVQALQDVAANTEF